MENQQVYGCVPISHGFFAGYANLGTTVALLCSGEFFRLSSVFVCHVIHVNFAGSASVFDLNMC